MLLGTLLKTLRGGPRVDEVAARSNAANFVMQTSGAMLKWTTMAKPIEDRLFISQEHNGPVQIDEQLDLRQQARRSPRLIDFVQVEANSMQAFVIHYMLQPPLGIVI